MLISIVSNSKKSKQKRGLLYHISTMVFNNLIIAPINALMQFRFKYPVIPNPSETGKYHNVIKENDAYKLADAAIVKVNEIPVESFNYNEHRMVVNFDEFNNLNIEQFYKMNSLETEIKYEGNINAYGRISTNFLI